MTRARDADRSGHSDRFLAGILAQSQTAANAFGRWPGFIIMLCTLLVVLMVSFAAMILAGHGVALALRTFAAPGHSSPSI